MSFLSKIFSYCVKNKFIRTGLVIALIVGLLTTFSVALICFFSVVGCLIGLSYVGEFFKSKKNKITDKIDSFGSRAPY